MHLRQPASVQGHMPVHSLFDREPALLRKDTLQHALLQWGPCFSLVRLVPAASLFKCNIPSLGLSRFFPQPHLCCTIEASQMAFKMTEGQPALAVRWRAHARRATNTSTNPSRSLPWIMSPTC